jgi:Txe/YoeB family toxin of Txe-Axe toxin-antitoxin module
MEASKDIKKLPSKLKEKLKTILIQQVAVNPKAGKKLIGDLFGFYSVRLSYRDRTVYSINEDMRIVFVHKARTHYGD